MVLSGRVALVTGSTSGIGEGIAKRLAAAGADIMLNGFGDAKEIEQLRAAIERDANVRCRYNGADLSKADRVKALIEDTTEQLGQVDILVNNAGIQHTAKTHEFPDEKWELIMAINLSAVFYASKAVLPQMYERGYGRIINIASAHGLVASPKKAAYVAAKHAVVGLTKVIALETAESKGLSCNAICPGWVLTPLVQKQIDANAENAGISVEQAKRELLAEKQPSMEFVTPEQLGDFTAFLCSEAAEQIKGQALPMDGGWTAR